MAFVFNPFTGNLDIVRIPVQDNSTPPTMSGNGDIQTATISNNGRIYFEANGTRYYVQAVIAGLNVSQGQPIPIGMGLTMTYANAIN